MPEINLTKDQGNEVDPLRSTDPMDILVRNVRDVLLMECDFMGNQDYPITDEWKKYRQDLRDITKTSNPTYIEGTSTPVKDKDTDEVVGITWPTPPDDSLYVPKYPMHYEHPARGAKRGKPKSS